MKYDFSKDLYRWYGEKGETLIDRIFRQPEIKYISLLRKTQNCSFKPLKLFYRARLKRMADKTQIQIPWTTTIGEGFYIGHTGRIVINPKSKLGKNINIATGVVIGQENRGERKGTPTIKDNCWIGANAVIVGNITVGSDVLIAPLTYVNFDVPDHSIVVGNPGRVIPRENATEGYINRCI